MGKNLIGSFRRALGSSLSYGTFMLRRPFPRPLSLSSLLAFIRWTCRWDSVNGTVVDVSGALHLQLHSQLPSRILNTVFAFIRKHHFSFGNLSSLNVTTCSVSTYPTSYRSPKVQPQQRHFMSSSVAPLLSNYNNHSTFIHSPQSHNLYQYPVSVHQHPSPPFPPK